MPGSGGPLGRSGLDAAADLQLIQGRLRLAMILRGALRPLAGLCEHRLGIA
jgi:hypothetical protein